MEKKNILFFLIALFIIIGIQLLNEDISHPIVLSLFFMILILFALIILLHKSELIDGKYIQKHIEDYFKFK